MMIEKNKGITLIALVVTIIVLLILTGVSISMLMGQNGILNRAVEAKEKTKQSQKEEKTDIAKMSEIIDETLDGETVDQVNDEKPGSLEKENDNTYIINSIEDLVVFSFDVRNGNTYDGKTVKLGLNLNFNSAKSYQDPYRTDYEKYGYDGELKELLMNGAGFIPIGTTSNLDKDKYSFKGVFDGNGKTIKNMKIKITSNDVTNDIRVELFGNNNGKIKNVGIKDCNVYAKLDTEGNNTVIVGGIVGYNYGTIQGCFVSGNLEAVGEKNSKTRIGGITGNLAGNSSGKIQNCYNLSNLKATGSLITVGGGIAGATTADTIIENCYNTGKIDLNVSGGTETAGGISGYCTSTNIKNSYNIGGISIISTEGNEIDAGGIIGFAADGEIINCCNAGMVSIECNQENHKGGIIGAYYTNGDYTGKLEKCYYLNNTSEEGIGSTSYKNNIDIIKIEQINNAPKTIDIIGNEYKIDEKNINSGYPILNWQ